MRSVKGWTNVCCWLLVCLARPLLGDEPTPVAAVSFRDQVAPLLAARCLECHRGPEPKGGLDLTRRESALRGGESGAVLAPGNSADSPLWQRVAAGEMPPEHPLTQDEQQVLRRWIDQGLAWDLESIDPFKYTTDRRAGYDWWSLQPLMDLDPPDVGDDRWPRNEIDRFVLRQLEQAGLRPAPDAEPRTLVRRLFFDLIGLPPTPEQVQRFAADPSDAAYAQLVDNLLSSPHYGERWGRHWLDVVRFGESDGFERNAPRDQLWHYRDWVIQALDDDMPYDEFVRWQLAGDLLQPGPAGAAAASFLVCGVHNTVVGSSERMKRLARQDELEEIVGTVGQTFLGLTVNCARCHDHKFDPITSQEYYRLIAAIDGVEHGTRKLALEEVARQLPEIDQQIETLKAAIQRIDDTARAAILQRRQQQPEGERPVVERPTPYASWDFARDWQDRTGNLHCQPAGGARLNGQALVVDGQSGYAQSAPLDRDLGEKTLEAWVVLDSLDQRGGAAISVQTLDGNVFDAIVFGEREPRRWMAGSDSFQRTQSFDGPQEDEATGQPVCLAIVYQQDGTITAYRNGIPYGQPYQTGFVRFAAGQAQVIFGLRHAPAMPGRLLAGQILRASLYDRALDPQAIAASAGVANQYVSQQAILESLDPADAQRREQLQPQLAASQQRRDEMAAQSQLEIYTVVPRTPGEMRVHVRGSVTDFGDVVSPGGIGAISGLDADFGIAPSAPDAQRRLHLAQWVTAANNPLLARVMANRIWHYHFGRGLVDTPNDFGFNGGRPSHPRLLDWLARQLRGDGYRLKALHRLIVLSSTYRQSSARNDQALALDADDRLLWRFPPRRIDAEVLRDAMLAIAGQLNTRRGGPGFKDVSVTYNDGTTYYEPIDTADAESCRRTVYRFVPRGGRSAILDTFDCPDPSATAPRRSVTTTPLQALTLMNNAFVLRMSDQLAARVRAESGADSRQQVRRAWMLTLGRPPDEAELDASLHVVENSGLSTLCRGLFNLNEFVVVE